MSHSGTKIIQARKFMRARSAPASRTTVIAAKTNWKKTMVDIGNLAVIFADGMTAYAMESDRSKEVKMVQLLPHKAKEHARMLTCFNSDVDDKMGLGIPTRPGIICAPNAIW